MLNKRGKGCAIVHFLKERVGLSSKQTDMRTNPHTKYFHNSLFFTNFAMMEYFPMVHTDKGCANQHYPRKNNNNP